MSSQVPVIKQTPPLEPAPASAPRKPVDLDAWTKAIEKAARENEELIKALAK